MKRFLASVANVELFTKTNGVLEHFASAHTLTDTSIDFQISMEDVRGGQGAKLFGRFGHTTGMTLQMTDAMFDINYLRLNIGASENNESLKSVLVEGESWTFDGSSDITLKNTVVNVGHLCGLDQAVCWVHKGDCSGVGNDISVPVSGATVAAADLIDAQFGQGDILTFSYFREDPTAHLFDVSATFIPAEVTAVMTAPEFAGDSSNATTGEVAGQLTVKIPRLQLDGQFELGLNMTSAATVSLNGTALATIDPISGKEYYAEILETLNAESDFRTGLSEIAVDQDYLDHGDVPYIIGKYSGGGYRKIAAASIESQKITNKATGASTEISGYIYANTSTYDSFDLTGGKWGKTGSAYVCVFEPMLSDTDYTAALAYKNGTSTTVPTAAAATLFRDADAITLT